MEDIKYITEAVGRSTPSRLDKETGRVTVKTVQNKMRKLMLIWQRKTNFTIPSAVHNSVAPVSVPAGQPTLKY
jgi:chromosome condensin MukBEF MukE localization factor